LIHKVNEENKKVVVIGAFWAKSDWQATFKPSTSVSAK
jgi:hypothetical protein